MKPPITVIGAGLSGSEAALQLAHRNIPVDLYEMRPKTQTAAHKTELFAELICSNSLKSNRLTAGHGLLKEELRILGSKLIGFAEQNQVPSGESLAVDRTAFAMSVTKAIEENPLIRVHREEVKEIKENTITLLCAGPLISPDLSEHLKKLTGDANFFFFDAVSPVVDASSIHFEKVFWGSRYGKGGEDFLNCPMNKEQYLNFWRELCAAKKHEMHDFEEGHFFEGCLPIEEIAKRGEKSLAFGPLKPVGLLHPETGERPYGVVQLRRENSRGTILNLVGFQTRLTEKEQERVFRMIPGLENGIFLRYGKMHRNTFLCAPRVLDSYLRLKRNLSVFVAGQLTGSEGYTEAIATGILCGINASRMISNLPLIQPPVNSAIGSLVQYLIVASPSHFQPMNFNFGLLPPILNPPKSKIEKKTIMAKRSIDELKIWVKEL